MVSCRTGSQAQSEEKLLVCPSPLLAEASRKREWDEGEGGGEGGGAWAGTTLQIYKEAVEIYHVIELNLC